MRATVAGLLVVVTACTTETSSTPQTPATDTPSTLATTTTVAVTTTLGMDDCPAGGGGQTRRGLYCPPDLPLGLREIDRTYLMMPGTFTSREFPHTFEFTRDSSWEGFPDNDFFLNLDAPGNPTSLSIGLPEDIPVWEEAIETDECLNVVETGTSTVGGYPADYVDFAATCLVVVPVPIAFNVWDGLRVRLYKFDTGDLTFPLLVGEWSDEFNAYFTDVAEPIIDSIRFLD